MQKTYLIILIILFTTALLYSAGLCVPADITDISNRDYTDTVVNILKYYLYGILTVDHNMI